MTPLKKIIEVHGPCLEKIAPWLDGKAMLTALSIIESSYGTNVGPRHERAYDWGGIYQNRNLLATYGCRAAASYGSWQIMFVSAYELGFKGPPEDLQRDEIGIYWVMEYLDKRIVQRGAERLQDVFDAYNSGSFKDGNVPQEYVAKGMNEYIKYMNENKGERNG